MYIKHARKLVKLIKNSKKYLKSKDSEHFKIKVRLLKYLSVGT